MAKTKRERCADILSRLLGFTVYPRQLECARGSQLRQDIFRWETRGLKDLTGDPVFVGCWDTMTECVRHGIMLTKTDIHNYFEAHADA